MLFFLSPECRRIRQTGSLVDNRRRQHGLPRKIQVLSVFAKLLTPGEDASC